MRPVPIVDVHIVDRVTVVIRGIVDQDADRPQSRMNGGNRSLQRFNVGQITVEEQGAEFRGESLARRVLDVDEGNPGA